MVEYTWYSALGNRFWRIVGKRKECPVGKGRVCEMDFGGRLNTFPVRSALLKHNFLHRLAERNVTCVPYRSLSRSGVGAPFPSPSFAAEFPARVARSPTMRQPLLIAPPHYCPTFIASIPPRFATPPLPPTCSLDCPATLFPPVHPFALLPSLLFLTPYSSLWPNGDSLPSALVFNSFSFLGSFSLAFPLSHYATMIISRKSEQSQRVTMDELHSRKTATCDFCLYFQNSKLYSKYKINYSFFAVRKVRPRWKVRNAHLPPFTWGAYAKVVLCTL